MRLCVVLTRSVLQSFFCYIRSLPPYTISTLLWILRASTKRKSDDSLQMTQSDHTGSIRRNNEHMDPRNTVEIESTTQESLRTKSMRLYATFRSRVQWKQLQHLVQVNKGYRAIVSKRLQNTLSALFIQLWEKIESTRKNTMDSNPYSLLCKTFLFSLFLSLIESCFRSDIALCFIQIESRITKVKYLQQLKRCSLIPWR